MQRHQEHWAPIPNMTSFVFLLHIRWHHRLTYCFHFPTSSCMEQALLIHNVMLLTHLGKKKKKKVQSTVKICFKFSFSCCLKSSLLLLSLRNNNVSSKCLSFKVAGFISCSLLPGLRKSVNVNDSHSTEATSKEYSNVKAN